MRRALVFGVACLLLLGSAPSALAARPSATFRVDQACRTDSVVAFSVSWSHIHPGSVTEIRVWAGTTDTDPGGVWSEPVTSRKATTATFEIPWTWFAGPGYVEAVVRAVSSRGGHYEDYTHFPIYLSELPACTTG